VSCTFVFYTNKVKKADNPQYGGPKLCNPPNDGPKLTEQRYHYKGSRYVTVGLLQLGLGLGP